MRTIKIGIVAEGGSDSIVIQGLLRSYIKKSGAFPDCELKFLNLQPYIDNTSRSRFSEGGWMQVFKWCISNPPQERRVAYLGDGLFSDGMDAFNCSALVIHMDADICDKIGDKTTVTPVPQKTHVPATRGRFIADVLNEWLWPPGEVSDQKHLISPAVESTEAWLVAGLSEEDNLPESDHDIQKRLAELDHIVIRNSPVPKDLKKPKKSFVNYMKITNFASDNIDRILLKCPHFKAMVDQVAQIVNATPA